jgi:hypothetical protein
MKRFLNIAKILLSFVALISFTSCFQYPEGPIFTVQTRAERLNGTWKLTSATDATGQNVLGDTSFSNTTLTAIASRSGSDEWLVFQNGNLRSTGTFEFAQHGDDIIVIYSLLDYSDVNGDQQFYQIRKLTDKYFYYIDQNGNTLHYQKY